MNSFVCRRSPLPTWVVPSTEHSFCRSLQFRVSVARRQVRFQARKRGWRDLQVVLRDGPMFDVGQGRPMNPVRPNAIMVKICGVTNVEDAVMAAQAGATFVGMILWPKSKRSVCLGTAKAIAHAARLHKAEPVGVFVDEDAETIESCCKAANIGIAQLHGSGARSALKSLPPFLKTIYVLHVDKSGVIQTPVPEARVVDWILLDSMQGGSGDSFNWTKLKGLSLSSKSGWLLAGGLNPDNVSRAISILQPDFVDVSSGVTKQDGLLKDPARVLAFIGAVRG